MAPDGPAAQCGKIFIGDVIVGIDGQFLSLQIRKLNL